METGQRIPRRNRSSIPALPRELTLGFLSLPGTVWAFGSEAAQASELYGDLTGPPHQICENPRELTKVSGNDVVLCTTRHLTSSFMHSLYVQAARTGTPGLICAPSESALEEVCLQRFRQFVQQRPELSRRIFVYTSLDFKMATRGRDIFISGAQSRETLPSLLSSGADVLSIFGHSNGIDLSLPSRLYACPFVAGSAAPGLLKPPCQSDGICLRFHSRPTIEEAREAGWIVPLSILQAQILFLASCGVVKVHDGCIDPSYGLAAALLQQANFGVMVTTWRTEVTRPGCFNSLINNLSSGIPAGHAVHRFNTSGLAKDLGTSLCIVGDPCFALGKSGLFDPIPILDPDKPTKPAAVLEKPKGKAELLRLAVLRANSCDPILGIPLAERLGALGDLTSNSAFGVPEFSELDSQILDFLNQDPHLGRFFGDFAQIDSVNENGVCGSCLGPARVFSISFPGYDVKPLRLLGCPCCEESSVLPLGWDLRLNVADLKDGVVSLEGVPEDAQIRVCLPNIWKEPVIYFTWRREDRQLPSFHIPKSIPSIPFECRILLARRLELASIGFNLRLLPDGKYATGFAVDSKSNHSLPSQSDAHRDIKYTHPSSLLADPENSAR